MTNTHKGRHIGELLGLWVFLLGCWTVYRLVSLPYIEPFGSMKFYLAQVIFMPIIFLPPIFLYWKFVRKETATPVRFFPDYSSKKSVVIKALVFGIILIIVELVLHFIRSYAIFNSGLFGDTKLEFEFGFLDTESWSHYLVMALTNLLIIAIVEEFVFRGFFQNQFEKVLPKWQSLAMASILFGLMHLPIAILVYEMEGLLLVYSLIEWIGMGMIFGYAYQISRNIWVCIFWHGLHNVLIGTFNWRMVEYEKVPSEMVQFSVGSLGLIVYFMTTMMLLYISRNKFTDDTAWNGLAL
jgi:membrane protease YdiL (CAAX protease family)